jgi:hypothetical protein
MIERHNEPRESLRSLLLASGSHSAEPAELGLASWRFVLHGPAEAAGASGAGKWHFCRNQARPLRHNPRSGRPPIPVTTNRRLISSI